MKDKSKGGQEIMTVEGLASYLGVSVRTVYVMAHEGEVPGTKVAGSWRFPKAAIDAWLMKKALGNVGAEYRGGKWPFDEIMAANENDNGED